MSQIPAAPAQNSQTAPKSAAVPPAPRPTWLDFFFIVLGFALSMILAEWSNFGAAATQATPQVVVEQLLTFLPKLLFLPVGVLLFWPLFWLTQWLRGRTDSMSSGEWLWSIAWLASLPVIAWVGWQHFAEVPEILPASLDKRWISMGYAVGTLALGALAALITPFGLFARRPRPWTHSLCLVLLIWPAVWLALFMAWGIELK